MVTLINIRKTGDNVSTSYIPENSSEEGYIKLDLGGNVVESRLTSYDEEMPDYFSFAKRELKKLMRYDPMPEKSRVVWY